MPLNTNPGPHYAAEPPSPGTRLSIWSVVAVLAALQFGAGLIQGFYLPLLPDIGAHLHVAAGPLNWFFSVGLLGAAVSIPILSALGDRYGHRRLLNVAVWATAAGSALICLAPSFLVVLLGCGIQAPILVWLALEIALVRDKLAGARATTGIGLLASSLSAGYLLGSLVAGSIQSVLGDIRLTLAIPVVLTVLCGVVTMFLVPESTTRTNRPIDWIGALSVSLGLAAILLTMLQAGRTGWAAPRIWIGITAGSVVFVAWAWWELRTDHPMVNLRLFASTAILPAMLLTLCYGVVVYGETVPLVTFLSADPKKLGYGFGFSSSAISLSIAAILVALVVGSSLSGPISNKIGVRSVLSIGIGVAGVSYVSMVFFHSSVWMILGAGAALNFGCGLLIAGLPIYISGVVPRDNVATATGTYSTLKVLGASVATASFGTLLSSFTSATSGAPTMSGYIAVWFTCAAPAAAALVMLALVWRA
ncbi:MFS transporter [Nocardia sp. NPDC059246]|uniref:MFS transporter n=1 Tax=unclassified Nocardia TaxID=2637762 RepID=UPI0036C9CE4A